MDTEEPTYPELLDFAYSLAEQLVTETDAEVEQLIKQAISSAYPQHKLRLHMGCGSHRCKEETIDQPVADSKGTMSFVHGNPMVGCSIGLLHRKVPVVGVIAQPFLNRILSARRGGGAFMNRFVALPLTGGIAQPLSKLSECIIAAEWGSDRSAQVLQARSESHLRLLGQGEQGKMCHALRTTGSSTCDIAMVATGEVDLYWDAGCYPWDVAAGIVIVSEAGGFFAGGKEAHEQGLAPADVVMNRRYVFVRAVPGARPAESQALQNRLVTELYETVLEWKTSDM